jgi:hypothetical protein
MKQAKDWIVLSLFVFLAVVIGFLVSFYFKNLKNEKVINELIQEKARLQQNVQETKTILSSLELENSNLKKTLEIQNKELSDIIKKRNEEIVSLTNVSLRLKNQIIELKNLQSIVLDKTDKEVVVLDKECQNCFASYRLKIPFEEISEFLKVYGYTISNPNEAYVNLEFIKDIELNVVVSKNEKGELKTYIDTNSENVLPVKINFSLDEKAFKKRWYEKISLGLDMAFSNKVGILPSLRANFDISDSLYISGHIGTGADFQFWGLGFGIYPFVR